MIVKMMPRKLWAFTAFCCGFVVLWLIFIYAFQNSEDNAARSYKKYYKTEVSHSTRFPPHRSGKTGSHKSQSHQTSRRSEKNQSIGIVRVEDVPNVQVTDINCAALIGGDEVERVRAVQFYTEQSKRAISNEEMMSMTQDCQSFVKKRQYITKPVSSEEFNFPIAFSILLYRDIEQFERLLRSIYRPQNIYCVHIERKSSRLFKKACKAIAGCFENVFVVPVSISVEWGHYSVLEPELACMEELWKRSKKWKYFINLTGQEFPLKTNGDLVKILNIYNGANNMEGTVVRQSAALKSYLSNPPFGMTITKGSVHITASRGFVDYLLHNATALKFREWIQEIPIPDELFFSSLNHNPQLGVPGAYQGIPETDTRRNLFITRFKNWGTWPFAWRCEGIWVRQICIFGVGDLPLLASRPELFANKFHIDYQPLALDCMEERHYNLTRDELQGKRTLNLNIYRELDFVQNHV